MEHSCRLCDGPCNCPRDEEGRCLFCDECNGQCPECGADLGGSFPTCASCQLIAALKGGPA